MSLASSRENTSKKLWYSGRTTLAISAPLSGGRGSAWSAVVGAGSLLTALRWVCLVGGAPGLTLSVKTSYPWSMSFLKAVAPMMLIRGGTCLVNGMAYAESCDICTGGESEMGEEVSGGGEPRADGVGTTEWNSPRVLFRV